MKNEHDANGHGKHKIDKAFLIIAPGCFRCVIQKTAQHFKEQDHCVQQEFQTERNEHKRTDQKTDEHDQTGSADLSLGLFAVYRIGPSLILREKGKRDRKQNRGEQETKDCIRGIDMTLIPHRQKKIVEHILVILSITCAGVIIMSHVDSFKGVTLFREKKQDLNSYVNGMWKWNARA